MPNVVLDALYTDIDIIVSMHLAGRQSWSITVNMVELLGVKILTNYLMQCWMPFIKNGDQHKENIIISNNIE